MAAEPSPAASDGEDAARTSRACLAEAEAVLNCIAASQREYAENPRKHDPGRCNDTFARFMRCTHVNVERRAAPTKPLQRYSYASRAECCILQACGRRGP
jgi:hypothetical protein